MAEPRLSVVKGRLSVVLSFFNEADVIPELVRRLRATLGSEVSQGTIRDFELVFVNDASTDESVELLSRESQARGDIRIVNMSRNFGVSPCVMAGLRHASGEAVVYMDADLQDPPEVIPAMIAEWRGGADVVHTVRRSRAGETRFKLAITRLGYWILNRFSEVEIIPNAGDFKLMSRRAADQVIRHSEAKPFMRALVTSVGFRQVHIPYDREARHSGETKFPILSYSVFRNFFDSALISFSDAPLKLTSLLGILVSFVSFGLLVHVLIEKIRGHNIPGWTAVMASISFLGGVQLVSIGMLGLYVNSVFIESKRRPNYIVESLIGFDNQESK